MYQAEEAASEPFDHFTALSLGESTNFEGCEPFQINRPNAGGWTLLMYACYRGLGEVVSDLKTRGASLTQVNSCGLTALIISAIAGELEILRDVFSQKILETACNIRGWTALFYAVNYGREDCVEFLLSKGANAHCRDKSGLTSADIAVKAGMERMFAILTETSKPPARSPLSPMPKIDGIGLPVTPIKKTPKVTDIFKAKKTYTPNKIDKENKTPQHFNRKEYVQMTPPRALIAANKSSPYSLNHELNSKTPKTLTTPTVLEFLRDLDLVKYWPIFRDEEVDFETFITFDDQNLQEIGISLYGPRRKIALAIKEYRSYHEGNGKLLKRPMWTK